MKVLLNFIGAILFIVLIAGFVEPFLFSAADDFMVLGGVVIAIASLIAVIFWAKYLWKITNKKMAEHIVPLLLLCLIIGAVGCSRVPAGNVGIKVYLLGSRKGVDHEVLPVGRYYIGVNEELYLYPVYKQTFNWCKSLDEGNARDESISFQTKDGLTVNGDIGISYHLVPDSVPKVFQTYRKGIDEITGIYLRNMVRDALVSNASTMPIESVYGEGKQELILAAFQDVRKQCAPLGIEIEKLFIINELRLPQQVVDAINAKIQATQDAMRAENEVRKAKAEAQIKIAQAEGEARANYLRGASITQNLIEWRRMEIQQQQIAKWNGAYPSTMVGGGQGMLYNLSAGK